MQSLSSYVQERTQCTREMHGVDKLPALDVMMLYCEERSHTCGASLTLINASPFRGLICFEPASIASSCSAAATFDLYGNKACTSGSKHFT